MRKLIHVLDNLTTFYLSAFMHEKSAHPCSHSCRIVNRIEFAEMWRHTTHKSLRLVGQVSRQIHGIGGVDKAAFSGVISHVIMGVCEPLDVFDPL